MSALAKAVAGLRELAPYAAIELILPGGSLVALALWLYRRQRATGPSCALAPGTAHQVAGCERQSQHDDGQDDEQQQDFPGEITHLLA